MRLFASFLVVVTMLAAALVAPAMALPVERVERGNLVMEGIPEIPAAVDEGLRRYQNIRSAGLLDWHPSGEGILISTRFGETSQVHHVRTAGGARHQLTYFDEPVRGVAVSPDRAANIFIFLKDEGGSESYQLVMQDLASGAHRVLTRGAARHGGVVWSRHGRRFAYYTTARNGRDWDIHVASAAAPEGGKAVLEREGTWVPVEWSPDGRRLLVLRLVSASENHPHELDLATGALTPLQPDGGKIAYGSMAYGGDGAGVFLASDEGSEFQHLRYLDLATRRLEVLTGHIPWDVDDVTVSHSGRYLAYVINEDGVARLRLRDLEAGSDLALPDLPMGLVGSLRFDPSDQRLGMVLNTAATPGDVYVLHLADRRLERWTESEVGGLDTGAFIHPELIRYPTFDEVEGSPRTIPAFYYRPRGSGPFPVVIQIHGGPEGQSRPRFSATTQYYLQEMGLAVLVPNVRGSTGYGRSYAEMDNGYKREDSVRDIGALLRWVDSRPELDRERIGVMGGSYGGYMTLATMVHYSEHLRAGVDTVGISNFVSFLENTQDYRRDLRRVEYGDERDPEMRQFLSEISPTRHAARIHRPMFIVQGLNDPRVPVTESEQMVEVMRKNGGDVWYLMARDEGHGFSKKSNRDYYQSAVSVFLRQHLVGAKPAAASMDGGR